MSEPVSEQYERCGMVVPFVCLTPDVSVVLRRDSAKLRSSVSVRCTVGAGRGTELAETETCNCFQKRIPSLPMQEIPSFKYLQ